MSWLEIQTIIVILLSVLCIQVHSDIYKSVMWTTNNPLFSDSGSDLSPCFGEDLEMRVHLQSSLPIVCPFDFIIMKTLSSKPATGVLYENFWIVYDKESFDNCDINMTYVDQDNENNRNKKLLECNSPEALKSFAYSIDFKAKTLANSGISFEGGRYYYFLATSDGTDGSLNNTKGGHCNDPKVRMKFKVYICKTDDEKCQNVSIGEFLCPSKPTTSPPTATPSTSPATSQPSTQTEVTTNSTAGPTTSTSTSTFTFISGSQKTVNASMNGSSPIGTQSQESKDILDELSWWKKIAIGSICLFVLVLVLLVVCFVKWRKEKHGSGFCFTDINNKVTPPESEPTSLEYEYGTQPNLKYSYNNLKFRPDDHEAGKTTFHTTAVDKPDTQTQEQNGNQKEKQEKEPGKPHPGVNSEQNENGTTISGVNNEQTGNGTPGEKENGDKDRHVQNHEDKERDLIESNPNVGVNNETTENEMPRRVENGEREWKKHKHKHKHKDKDNDRHSKNLSDAIPLPPLRNCSIVLKNHSPRPEKRELEVHRGSGIDC